MNTEDIIFKSDLGEEVKKELRAESGTNNLPKALKHFKENIKDYPVTIEVIRLIENSLQELECTNLIDRFNVSKNIIVKHINDPKFPIYKNWTVENIPSKILGEYITKAIIMYWATETMFGIAENLYQELKPLTDKSKEIKKLKNSDFKDLKNTALINNKIVNKFDVIDLENYNGRDIKTPIDKNRKTLITFSLTADYNEGLSRINYYDRYVHDIVCSMELENQKIFTPNSILKVIEGKKNNYSDTQKEEIIKSLDKMSLIRIKIDYSKEAELKKWGINNLKIENYLLPLKKITIETGGNILDGYELIDKPPLLEYSKLNNQIISIKTDEVKSLGYDKYGINYYLLRRVKIAEYKKTQSYKTIILENMFKDLQIKDRWEDKDKKIRTVKRILTVLDRMKFIGLLKDYSYDKKESKINLRF